jgi:demethylmenaquinone methyltransferase/2-methoxy-6-polyprenyl-1,4-benzoquinol methylase
MLDFYGWAYDTCLGPILSKTRHWMAAYVREKNLFPVLDLCTGTGAFCRIIGGDPQHSVWGLDLDGRFLRYARAKAPHIPFIQADAGRMPFTDSVFGAVILSYAVHDKAPGQRTAMMEEARRVLCAQGQILFLDFEIPWDRASRMGRVFTYGIERLAGGEHFQNSQQFLRAGGLHAFLALSHCVELESRSLPWGNSRIVAARFRE